MKLIPLEIKGLSLVQLKVHGDKRGFFVERYNRAQYEELGLPTQFMQDNHSRSGPHVLRGLHYQTNPAQGKLVGVVRGKIWDIAVDIRPDSATFGKSFSVEISDENGLMLWIPGGFAHGFCVLGEEPADLLYKVDALYNPSTEGGIQWSDPDLKIPWPVKDPVVSARDEKLSSFSDYKRNLPQWAFNKN